MQRTPACSAVGGDGRAGATKHDDEEEEEEEEGENGFWADAAAAAVVVADGDGVGDRTGLMKGGADDG